MLENLLQEETGEVKDRRIGWNNCNLRKAGELKNRKNGQQDRRKEKSRDKEIRYKDGMNITQK